METVHSKDEIKLAVQKNSSQDQTVNPRCRPSMKNLVYVRRKHEAQSGKTRTSNKEEATGQSQSGKSRPSNKEEAIGQSQSGKTTISNKEEATGQSHSEQEVDHPMVTINTEQESPPEEEPVNTGYSKATSVLVPCYTLSSGAPSIPISVKHSNGISLGDNIASPGSKQHRGLDESHWREQFTRLQENLESIDHSNQEACTNMLRSSTPAERSKLAVELEKRAIWLVMEEDREMERMKALNILGNSKPEK